MCTLTLCSSHGCRANTAAAHLVADKSLCYIAGRPQETDIAQGQSSMNITECLGKERDIYFLILCFSTVLIRWIHLNTKRKSEMVASHQITLSLAYCCRTEILAHRAHKWKCWMRRSLGWCCSESRESPSEWSHSRWERCSSQWESAWSGSAPRLEDNTGWLNSDLFKVVDTGLL